MRFGRSGVVKVGLAISLSTNRACKISLISWMISFVSVVYIMEIGDLLSVKVRFVRHDAGL